MQVLIVNAPKSVAFWAIPGQIQRTISATNPEILENFWEKYSDLLGKLTLKS
jgi:hypothetical protein